MNPFDPISEKVFELKEMLCVFAPLREDGSWCFCALVAGCSGFRFCSVSLWLKKEV